MTLFYSRNLKKRIGTVCKLWGRQGWGSTQIPITSCIPSWAFPNESCVSHSSFWVEYTVFGQKSKRSVFKGPILNVPIWTVIKMWFYRHKEDVWIQHTFCYSKILVQYLVLFPKASNPILVAAGHEHWLQALFPDIFIS